MAVWIVRASIALLLVSACKDEPAGEGPSPSAGPSAAMLEAADEEPQDAGAQQKGAASAAGERVEIPAGKLVAGSTPGDRGRDPMLEPALLELELPAFEIDKLPYPNDPREAPKTAVSRQQAGELCAARGGRLCSELEWERACKGPDATPYAGGQVWDPGCATSPETCASGFGVLAMGMAMREWTASDVLPIEKLQPQAAAVRGAASDAADVDHRCARRAAVSPDAASGDLGFRCCYGDAPSATIPSPSYVATVRKVELSPSRLGEMFAAIERLAPLAKEEIVYFREEAAVDEIMRRGRARGMDAGSTPPNTELTTSPIIWNPVPGEEILLVAGRSGEKTSFIVAFHVLPGDRHRVGNALVMHDEVGPVAIVYNPYVRRKLHWTSCWECYGEVGNITYRDDNRVVITQK